MKGLLLFLISIISVSLVFVLSTVFSIIYYVTHFWKLRQAYNKIDKYFYDMAHSVDQFGNVNCARLFDHVMIMKKWRSAIAFDTVQYHKFGDVDDTISYILADNWITDKLSKFGTFWKNFLNFVDTTEEGDHMEKSIMAKIKQDRLAKDRLDMKWTQPEYKYLVDRVNEQDREQKRSENYARYK